MFDKQRERETISRAESDRVVGKLAHRSERRSAHKRSGRASRVRSRARESSDHAQVGRCLASRQFAYWHQQSTPSEHMQSIVSVRSGP